MVTDINCCCFAVLLRFSERVTNLVSQNAAVNYTLVVLETDLLMKEFIDCFGAVIYMQLLIDVEAMPSNSFGAYGKPNSNLFI